MTFTSSPFYSFIRFNCWIKEIKSIYPVAVNSSINQFEGQAISLSTLLAQSLILKRLKSKLTPLSMVWGASYRETVLQVFQQR